MIDPEGLMMIEPQGMASPEPIIDELTRKMTAAWRARYTNMEEQYLGYHRCVCGATSDNRDHSVSWRRTNSLCVHYLAFHRHAVPESEIEKVRALPPDEADPTEDELRIPKGIRER
jgi:hypothetical protein